MAITQMATVTDQAIFGSGTGGYSRGGPMTPAVTSLRAPCRHCRRPRDDGRGPGLTPELAVDYLRELSADIRAAVVLDAGRGARRRPAGAGGRGRRLLAAAPDAAEIEVAVAGGAIHAARGARHAVVAVCGRYALPALIRYDLKVVLGELAADPGPARTRTEAA